jgi:hypothetical protein
VSLFHVTAIHVDQGNETDDSRLPMESSTPSGKKRKELKVHGSLNDLLE